MKFRNLALVAAGMLVLALTASAQITTVEGDVKGADGKPVQNAVVKITRTDVLLRVIAARSAETIASLSLVTASSWISSNIRLSCLHLERYGRRSQRGRVGRTGERAPRQLRSA